MADLLTAAMIEDDMDIVDGVTTVTVRQINPDTGATLATANNVTRLRRVVTGESAGAGDGGEVPSTTAKHHLKAVDISFTPKKRDEIEDADGTWVIETVQTMTFGTRHLCTTHKKP